MNIQLPQAQAGPATRGPAARPGRDGNGFAGQHRRRLLRADLLTVVAWASVAAAVALWLSDGGGSGPRHLPAAVTAAGIVAGLVGMDLVLLMLLLAARIPLMDRTVGHDRALEFHRKLGKPSLYLLLAHGLLIAVGYGMADGPGPRQRGNRPVVAGPGHVACLRFHGAVHRGGGDVPGGGPSPVPLRVLVRRASADLRRRGYGSSRTSSVLAGSSPRARGSAGTGRPSASATGAALLYFRVVQPIAATRRHRLTREPGGTGCSRRGEHRDEGPRSWTGWPAPAAGSSSGGSWPRACGGIPTRSVCPPNRASGRGRAGTLRITVRNLGRGSAQLVRLRTGTKVAVEGPYGLFGTAARTGTRWC